MASFAPSICTSGEIQRTSILQKAFEDLSGQLGIVLTEYGKQSLYGTSNTEIASETSLSKGIVAQRNQHIGEALAYYYNAASFSPTMPEVNRRISALSSSVSSGSLGENVRNLISWRNSWDNVLKECDSFLENHIPFEIIYDPTLKQEGAINYDAGTIALSFSLMTRPTDGFKMINDILKGLKKTGRQKEWGFQFWPSRTPNKIDRKNIDDYLVAKLSLWDSSSQFHPIKIYDVIPLKINMGLFDSNGNLISTASITHYCRESIITYDDYRYFGNWDIGQYIKSDVSINPEKTESKITFKAIEANKITDTLTIKILSIDNIDTETAAMNGYIKISEGKIKEKRQSAFLQWLFG
jgi:hypothetical protein